MAKSIAIYSRKSKFTGKGESIENQIELCRQYIEYHYSGEAPPKLLIYEDEGFSGKNMSRPQFKRMLKDAEDKKFSMLVCYRLDRISRNVSDFAKMIEGLNQQGIAFVSIRETFDTSTPMGRAMMYIACVFAQLERETIAERIRDNMYELSKTGRWLGGTTPTGYTSESVEKISVDNKMRKAYKLKLYPEETQTVAAIFRKYLETGSLTETDAFLVQNNYATKNNVSFSRYSIRSILTNPVYMIADEDAYQYIRGKSMYLYADKEAFDGKHGVMAYNRTEQENGKTHRNRSMDEWVISVGKHEGIISGKDFAKVQELLEINKSKAYKKPRSNAALLSGLLYCKSCGNNMRPKMTRRFTAEGDRIYDYLCLMKEKSKSKCCSMKNLNGNLLDGKVIEELVKIPEDEVLFTKELGKLYRNLSDDARRYGTDTDRYQKLLAENEKDINTLLKALKKASGSTAQQYIVRQIEELHEKGTKIKAQMEEAGLLLQGQSLSDLEISSLVMKMKDFGTLLKASALEQKRRAVRSLVEKAVWDGEKVELYLAAPQGEDSK